MSLSMSSPTTLASICDKLRGICASTEQDFLQVGGTLEGIMVRAREKAEALAGLLSDGVHDGEGEGRSVAAVIDQVSEWAGGAGQGGSSEQALHSLLGVVRAVSKPILNLQSAVQTLRAMGVAMLVESARLGSQASDFEALAREVRELAISIDKKAGVIMDVVESLTRLLEKTKSTVARLGSEQGKKLTALTAECSAGLAELHAEQEAIAAVSRQAQDGYRQVVESIGRLVVNLQFHDSTRQRIEHVQEALQQLEGETDPTIQVYQVELQAAQLSQASNSFQETVGDVRQDLGAVGEMAAGFAALARGRTGGSAGTHAGVSSSSIEERVGKVGVAVLEWSSSRRSLAAAAAQVHQACGGMSQLVSEVETVGRHMFRLALNAQIQAFGMAASGKVMVAVADNIRSVARDASGNAAAVGEALREVQTCAEGLAAALGGTTEAESQRAEGIATGIRESVAALRSKNEESHRGLTLIADGGEALAGDIAGLRQGLTADQAMADTATECLAAMEQLAAAARLAAGDHDAERHAELLHATLQRYTMHAEREVHHGMLARGVAGETGGAASPEKMEMVLAGAGDDLGDNVELF